METPGNTFKFSMMTCLNYFLADATRQTYGWQKLIRQMSLNDMHQSDVIVKRIEAGNQGAGFRAQAALIAWTKRRSETASSLCIKTLLEDVDSCQFEESSDNIVGEFATFTMAESGKTGGQWR